MSNGDMERKQTTSLQLNPYMLADAARQELPAGEPQVQIKAATIHTGGAFNLFSIVAPSGFSTPLHIHYSADVGVVVLEGSMTVFWGEEGKVAAAGTYLFMPRGTPHGFRVTEAGGVRVLYLSVPAGLDGFVQERLAWKDASDGLRAAARYKIEILGPLPD